MVRTKLTARRSYEKMRQLPAWIANREYGKKKKNLSPQNKTNITCTKDSEHYQKWRNCKDHQCKQKKKIFFFNHCLIF